MEDIIVIPIVVGVLFLGLPWLILHYITKWKQRAPSLTTEDEHLLDDMFETARRLEERLHTVERIIAADHPDFQPRRVNHSIETPLHIDQHHSPAR